MSTGRKRATEKRPGKASSNTPKASREFTRRARAHQERAARRATARRQVAIRKRLALPFGEESWRAIYRIPRAAWICALIAFMNAACWSLITPPFEVPDEPDHIAYVQLLVENGHLPQQGAGSYSEEELAAVDGLGQPAIHGKPAVRAIFSPQQQERVGAQLASGNLSRRGSGGAGLADNDPPLYYALQTIPYAMGAGGTILGRIELMRLLSALMGAIAALFVFMFVREALPGVPWAWTVGGLGAALAPLLGFITGGVNPDAMLVAVSAALFYCLARAFRRGLTRRLAIAIGLVMAIGFITKLNFVGLAPGAILGLILLARREARASGSDAYRSLALALVLAMSPVILYALVNVVSSHPVLGLVSGEIKALTGGHRSISKEISYIWQLYLPRLPGMHDDFGELFTTRQLWFNGLIGLYGWVDTPFPGWVYDLALIPAGLVAVLGIREMTSRRIALHRRVAELTAYAAMSLGALVLVGSSGYASYPTFPTEFVEPRYLLPLLPLLGVVLALAARGAGRRLGPVVGALVIMLMLALNIFSQLQVIARFYG
jgi:hypothetical protein